MPTTRQTACNALGRTRFAWALEVARSCGLRPAHRHLAATAATLTDPRTHHTLSRIGAGLVGIDPSRTTPLRPALTLTAPLVSVRRVRAGTPVGYGHAHVTPAPTYLGLVPLGYADGLPRAASGRAEVQVRGRRAAGRRPDLDGPGGRRPRRRRGPRSASTVTVFGPGDAGEPTVAEWAAWVGHARARDRHRDRARVPRRTRPAPRLRSVR